MGKRAYTWFAVFAAIFAVAIPAWAIHKEGGESASPQKVPSDLKEGKELFQTNCGSCHTLDKAGTDGVVGPNLDQLLGSATPDANVPRTQAAIENGINGRMPAGILAGGEAEEVSKFVGDVAGQ